MFTLSHSQRLQVITYLVQAKSLPISSHTKNLIAESWASQSEAPLQGIRWLNRGATLFFKIFGTETGLFIVLKCPGLGRAFEAWMYSLIGMAFHEE